MDAWTKLHFVIYSASLRKKYRSVQYYRYKVFDSTEVPCLSRPEFLRTDQYAAECCSPNYKAFWSKKVVFKIPREVEFWAILFQVTKKTILGRITNFSFEGVKRSIKRESKPSKRIGLDNDWYEVL